MRGFLRTKRLNQLGFDHVLIALAFVVMIAMGGTYALLKTNANAWSGSLKLGSNQAYCMTNSGNSQKPKAAIVVNKCDTKSQAQHWSIKNVGNSNDFQIVAAASGACIDDTKGGVTTDSKHRAYIQTWTCNSSDTAQVWKWGGNGNHQLINVRSGGCINDPGGSTAAPNNMLIVFSCAKSVNGNGANAQWFEGSNTGGSGGGTGGTPAPLPPNGTEGQIQVNGVCLQYASSKVTLATCSSTSSNQNWVIAYSDQGDGNPITITTGSGAVLCVNGNGSANGQAIIVAGSTSGCGGGTSFWGYRNGMLQTNGGTDEKSPLSKNFCMADLNNGNTSVQVSPCSGKSQQLWTLPAPPAGDPSGGGNGSGDNTGGGTGGSSDSGSSSGSNTADLTALLTQLKQVDPTFNCNVLTSATSLQLCRNIFGQ